MVLDRGQRRGGPGLCERLLERQFSLIMIRNCFVLEGDGWLPLRQSMVAPEMPTISMRPLRQDQATVFAESIVRTRFPNAAAWLAAEQGRWLARMSGGIPGLIELLQPYTPNFSAFRVHKQCRGARAARREPSRLRSNSTASRRTQ
jgi:hypothetical protein